MQWPTLTKKSHEVPKPAHVDELEGRHHQEPLRTSNRPRGVNNDVQFRYHNVQLLTAASFSAFFVMATVIGFLDARFPLVSFVTATACMAVAAWLAWLNLTRGLLYLFMSILVIFGTGAGWIAGMSIDRRFMTQYWAPVLRPSVNDVSPITPVAAVSDAGTLHFASSARVDLHRVLGRKNQEDGLVYCVAPVIGGDQETNQGNIWAVGIDCCSHASSFQCDDAGQAGALIGLVQFSPSWQLQHFWTASVQAAALYDLHLPPRPVFVRWVKSSDDLRSALLGKAVILLLVWLCLYFAASIVLASLLIYANILQIVPVSKTKEKYYDALLGNRPPEYGGTRRSADHRNAA